MAIPTIEVKIGKNKAVNPLTSGFIESVELREGLRSLDSLTVRMAFKRTPDVESTMKGYAAIGEEFEITMKGDSGERKVKGDIVEVRHSIVGDGDHILVLEGLESLHRVKQAHAGKAYTGSASALVEAVGKDAGLTVQAEGTAGTGGDFPALNQRVSSLFKRFADENNYFVRIEPGESTKVAFGRMNNSTGNVALNLDECSEIHIGYSLEGLVTKVSAKGYDEVTAKWVEGSATTSALKLISGGTGGAALAKKAFGELEMFIDNAPYAASSDLKALAEGRLQGLGERFLNGHLRCLGRPDAAAGAMLKLSGTKTLGWPFAAEFLIGETIHSAGGGEDYMTTIRFFSDSLPS